MADALEIIDVNTWLGSWPFDYLHEDTAAKLDALLALEGVSMAYVSTPEAAFNPTTSRQIAGLSDASGHMNGSSRL